MKRIDGDASDAGQRRTRAEKRPGSARPGRMRLLSLAAPTSRGVVRAAGLSGSRARDFEDFVAGDGARTTVQRTLPDPGFREGLRRRLWRIHLLKRGHRGLEGN